MPIRLRSPAVKKQSDPIKRQRPVVAGEDDTIDLDGVPVKTKREQKKVKKQEAEVDVIEL
jgi:hypothetical protein